MRRTSVATLIPFGVAMGSRAEARRALLALGTLMLVLCGPEGSAEERDASSADPVSSPANSATAETSANTLLIDTSQSTVHFRIGLLFLFDARGEFETIEGRVDRHADGVQVHARIPVTSASMDSSRWEAMLEGPQFLDGERHPWIEFESDRLDPATLQPGEAVPGQLCLRGVCQRERFVLHHLACSDASATTPERCELSASGSLLRAAYGMRSHRGALRNRIELKLDLVATGAPPSGVGPVSPEVPVR